MDKEGRGIFWALLGAGIMIFLIATGVGSCVAIAKHDGDKPFISITTK
jgi:hypothetical protein